MNSSNTMSYTIDRNIIITFSTENNPTHAIHTFMTKKYSSKFPIMSFWAPAPKPHTENSIPKKSLDTSLLLGQMLPHTLHVTKCLSLNLASKKHVDKDLKLVCKDHTQSNFLTARLDMSLLSFLSIVDFFS